MSLEAVRAWIVGASSGIGAALARELADRGAHVAISARRRLLLDEVAGDRMVVEPCDVTSLDSVHASAETVTRALGGLDLVVVAAGISLPIDARRFDAGTVAAVMTLNVMGTANVIEATLPQLLAQGSGTFSAIASVAGYRGIPGLEAYGASKAAQISMLESLRTSVRGTGVDVVTICPGWVESEMSASVANRTLVTSAAEAASTIADGLESGRVEIVFPLPIAIVGKLARLVPQRMWSAAWHKNRRRYAGPSS
ncbi:MAG TPA: SDR family NAD(P)-dependent oxidoreductase [Actinopolymorphaceae bacterium]